MTPDPMLDALLKAVRADENMPPRLHRIYASHKVPYGRVYRMWTTRGEMIAYVNRGEIADIPRIRAEPVDTGRGVFSPGLFGIPVVHE